MELVQQNPATALPYFWASFILAGDPENGGLGTAREPG
jgi:CHAT domain-containing protein